MIDINVLRENPDAVKASERKRGKDQKQVDIVLKLDQQWKKELKEL